MQTQQKNGERHSDGSGGFNADVGRNALKTYTDALNSGKCCRTGVLTSVFQIQGFTLHGNERWLSKPETPPWHVSLFNYRCKYTVIYIIFWKKHSFDFHWDLLARWRCKNSDSQPGGLDLTWDQPEGVTRWLAGQENRKKKHIYRYYIFFQIFLWSMCFDSWRSHNIKGLGIAVSDKKKTITRIPDLLLYVASSLSQSPQITHPTPTIPFSASDRRLNDTNRKSHF